MNVPAKPPGADEEKSPWHREIPTHKEVFVGELAQNGDWIVANISTNSFWPVASQKVRWRGVDIWILPIMKGFYPAVAMLVPPGWQARQKRAWHRSAVTSGCALLVLALQHSRRSQIAHHSSAPANR
jgi:hypothetical protein